MDNDIGGGAGGGLGAVLSGLSGLSDDQLTVGFDDALGEAHTVPELQAACRAARRLRRRADNAAPARRFLRWRTGDDGTVYLHGHHLVHWPDGGPTDLANLVLTCSRHHRYLHEGGWRLHGHPDTQLTYTAPTGHTCTSHPAPRPRPRRRHPPGPPTSGGP